MSDASPAMLLSRSVKTPPMAGDGSSNATPRRSRTPVHFGAPRTYVTLSREPGGFSSEIDIPDRA